MDKTGSNQERGVEKVEIEAKAATAARTAISIFVIYSTNLLIIS